jgi:hypothetical protein
MIFCINLIDFIELDVQIPIVIIHEGPYYSLKRKAHVF